MIGLIPQVRYILMSDLLVETLSQEWGAYREAGGKVVWVAL